MSNAKLLGLFEVSILHNIVHLLYGVAGLAMARSARSAVMARDTCLAPRSVAFGPC